LLFFRLSQTSLFHFFRLCFIYANFVMVKFQAVLVFFADKLFHFNRRLALV
jgi:hypothetical protein